MSNPNLNYRPDIDGLRAVAVLLVVLNHVGIEFFSGGFIGVDVFFVISGFLITGIITKQISNNTFKLREFYIRRALRILPAFYALLLFVIVAGYFILLPNDYSTLSQSAISSIAFASNIFFWIGSGGYFSSSAEEMPLLHIWSLSVEEQFYFIWPLAAILILKLKSHTLKALTIGSISVLSFALAEYGAAHEWTGAYFLLPFRAGELLVGSALALSIGNINSFRESRLISNALSLIGLVLILLPSLYLRDSSRFPGINALIPCLGAALIILSASFGGSLVSSLLSTKPFVKVGLISYSLYLWHWPLISFLHYSRVELTPTITAGVITASFILAYISWRFIENTYRQRREPISRALTAATAIAFSAVIIAPFSIYINNGIPSRFPYAMLTQEQLNTERQRYWQSIQTKSTTFSESGPTKKVLIVGNSHAYDLSYALTENNFKGQIKLIETTYYCFNFGHDPITPDRKPICEERLRNVLESQEIKTADIIYLHDNWSMKNLHGLGEVLHSIRNITSAKIVVVGPKMTFMEQPLVISKIAQSDHNANPKGINSLAAKYQKNSLWNYDKELAEYFKATTMQNIQYISALTIQCGDSRNCDILSQSGEYLYFDAGHFTLAGSKAFGAKLKDAESEIFN